VHSDWDDTEIDKEVDLINQEPGRAPLVNPDTFTGGPPGQPQPGPQPQAQPAGG
jgi:hypothetical protein